MRKGMLVAVLVVLAVTLALAQGAPYFWSLVVRTALTNNGTLAQVGTSVFTGAATFNGAIASNTIVEDDSARVEGPVTVNGSITLRDTLKFQSNGSTVLYVVDGGANADTLRIRYGNGTTADIKP